MRSAGIPLLVIVAVAAPGCMEAGCWGAGEGEVVWHQPGAFEALRRNANATTYWTTPNLWDLPADHPLKQRFGNSTQLILMSWGNSQGGASVPFDVRPTFVHAGGDVDDLRRGVVGLARHLAADPAQVDAWAERHRVAELTTRSDPTPLDLELDVPGAAAAAADAPVVELQTYQLSIGEGPVSWSLALARVEMYAAPGQLLSVQGGDWVRSPFAGDPKGDREAQRLAFDAARAAGLPDGPRDAVQVQEATLCG